MEKLLDPPHVFEVPPVYKTLIAGEEIWRVFFLGGSHPTQWNQFRDYGPTKSRFDHHTRPRRMQGRAILYGSWGPRAIPTTIAEVFQDTRHIDRDLNNPALASFRLSAPLNLLDTTGLWPVSAGGNMAINSGSRARARDWSRAIYRSYADVQGIWYLSSMTNRECIALYERAEGSLPATPESNTPLNNPLLTAGLSSIAADLGYTMSI